MWPHKLATLDVCLNEDQNVAQTKGPIKKIGCYVIACNNGTVDTGFKIVTSF
ncbi:453_t:CDS:2 [Entrophospora sp. SA101]|nr:453_t:CDS:2 [Entrophospora sp. SA101]